MMPIRKLADKIAAAVVECVNGDLGDYDMLILNNIEQVIEEALIRRGRPDVDATEVNEYRHLQVLQLVAESRLCCDAFLLGIDSLLVRQTLPAALAELTALKRMAERSADAMMALQAALQSSMRGQSLAQQSSDQMEETAVRALEFYAEGDNHKGRAGSPSAVSNDKGRRACRALETMSGESAEVDGEDQE